MDYEKLSRELRGNDLADLLELYARKSNRLTHEADSDSGERFRELSEEVDFLKGMIATKVMYENNYYINNQTGFSIWEKE